MKKIVILFLAGLCAVGGLCAQDTLEYGDYGYMYNFRPENHNFFYVSGSSNCTGAGSTLAKGTLGGFFMQEYYAEDTVDIYGVAITIEPGCIIGDSCGDDFPISKNKDLEYRALLGKITKRRNVGGERIRFDTIGVIAYKDGAFIRRSKFYYSRTYYWVSIEDSVMPCIEFYFPEPVRVADTFLVGSWSRHLMAAKYGKMLDSTEWTKNDTCPLPTEYHGDAYYGGGYKSPFYSTLAMSGYTKSGFPRSRVVWRINPNDNVLPWGYCFPISGLHCKQVPAGLTLGDTTGGNAAVSWRPCDMQNSEYALRLTYEKKGTDTIVSSADTAFQFTGLTPGAHYTCEVSLGCRYTTNKYDTVVYGNWSTPIEFTMPGVEPSDPDTIGPGIDTTGIDTTGIRNLAEGLPFDLQPNPASGSVVLTLDAVEGGTVAVTDLAGREVLQQPLQPGAKRHKIDIGQLPAGAYLVHVATPTATGTRRLLVQ